MSALPSSLSHLVALIGAAQAHAETLGPEAGEARRLLGEALAAARSADGRGGRPDEGLRPEDLTTDNDGGMG